MTIRIVRLRPGRAPEVVEIDNALEAQQAEVGGYIEMLQIGDGLSMRTGARVAWSCWGSSVSS